MARHAEPDARNLFSRSTTASRVTACGALRGAFPVLLSVRPYTTKALANHDRLPCEFSEEYGFPLLIRVPSDCAGVHFAAASVSFRWLSATRLPHSVADESLVVEQCINVRDANHSARKYRRIAVAGRQFV